MLLYNYFNITSFTCVCYCDRTDVIEFLAFKDIIINIIIIVVIIPNSPSKLQAIVLIV
jgi:hypothetical protein